MKNLLNLKNAKILSKKEQKSINGGNAGLCIDSCGPSAYPSSCPPDSFCQGVLCYPEGGGLVAEVFYCVGNGSGNQ